MKEIKEIFDVFDTEGRGLVHAKGKFRLNLDLIDALNSIGYSQK